MKETLTRIDENAESLTLPLDCILEGDSLEILKTLPSHSVDVIFADPPYNLQLNQRLLRPDNTRVKGVMDSWDHFDTFEQYDIFTTLWLKEAYRVLKDTGTLWVIGSYHNIFRVGSRLQDEGFWILNDLIWVKTNPMPNFKGMRFANAHETLIWCSKSPKAKYTFNYDSLKIFNDNLQMRSDWYFPLCTGKERLKNEKGKKIHATQKPEALLYRILLASTAPNDVVLDPFFGTGTTGAVAKALGRHFIGIEQNSTYIEAAQKRIDAVQEVEEGSLLESLPSKRTAPRIPFGALLENGFVHIGQPLYNKSKKYKAKIMADGRLSYKKKAGSIHQLAALLEETPSANGWTYWFYKDEQNILQPIDTLREHFRTSCHEPERVSQ